jgi:replication factor C small subunit
MEANYYSYSYEPWVEKYRPKTLDDIIGQTEIVDNLKAYVQSKNMPHLLFAGPPGVGKTTAFFALAHSLYGDDYKHNILDLNASDERGIEVVRGKIKDFARSAPISDVPFKLIFLDESDALTPEAQQALRRTMEMYSGNCRFILSCNWSSKIVEPIQSRCAVFRFKPLTNEEIAQMVERIAKAEGLEIEKAATDALIDVSGGDMRKVINILQSISMMNKKITEESVYKTASAAKPKEINLIIETALNGDFKTARQMLINLMTEGGLSGEDIILQIHKNIIEHNHPNLNDEKRVQIVDRIGEYNFRMVEGANERIQLEALLAYLAMVGKE